MRLDWLILAITFTVLVSGTLATHTAKLTWQTANVTGHWSGYACTHPSHAWDRNWDSAALHVGLSNGRGDYFTVVYSWDKDLIQGDYFKVSSVYAYAKEWAICDSDAGRLKIYSFKTKNWKQIGSAYCGTRTFGGRVDGDGWFDHSTNSVKLHLSSTWGTENKLYEVWVKEVDYWYNWFPRARVNLPDSIYLNQTRMIDANFSIYDLDGDPVNYTWKWLVNEKELNSTLENETLEEALEKENINLEIGDNITLEINACDPYNCTTINKTIPVVNYPPGLRISIPERVRGNQPVNASLELEDLDTENQSHNITCLIAGSESVTLENASLGINEVSILTPEDEGEYSLKCKVCDSIECREFSKDFVVDNTPPKIKSLEIPECTNLENMNYSLDEPGYLEFSFSLENFTTLEGLEELAKTKNITGQHTICIRPVDLAGNRGDIICKNATLDFNPPEIIYNESQITLPNSRISLGTKDKCGISEISGKFNGTNICHLEDNELLCNTTGMPRGLNSLEITARDKAGNTAIKNITVRINEIPEIENISLGPLYADSKLVCQYKVKNEPDQSYNTSISWFINGNKTSPESATLKRGDRVKCIITATDSLGESSSSEADATVMNKPPSITASWNPKYPEPGDILEFWINVSDIDGDNVTWNARFTNKTWNSPKFEFKPNITSPGNYTLKIQAWDGFNWTNTSLVIPYHLCGNGILEPGEECDGNANPGYKCNKCKLEKMSNPSPGGGGSGGGGGGSATGISETPLVPATFRPTPWCTIVSKGSREKEGWKWKTLLLLNVKINSNVTGFELVANSSKFNKCKASIGECRIENGQLIWNPGELESGNYTIILETEIDVPNFVLNKITKTLDPRITGKLKETDVKEKARKKEDKESQGEIKKRREGLENVDSRQIEKATVESILATKLSAKSRSTGLLELHSTPLEINLAITLAILGLGFIGKKTGYLRRLSIRLNAVMAKMSPRSRKPRSL